MDFFALPLELGVNTGSGACPVSQSQLRGTNRKVSLYTTINVEKDFQFKTV